MRQLSARSSMKLINLPKILQPFACDQLIRLGKDHDGGYLVNPLDLDSTEQLISFGIGTDCSFENAVHAYRSIESISYDNTVTTVQINSQRHTHVAKNVSAADTDNSVDIRNIVKNNRTFLKCDIDGGEYDILNHLITESKKLTGLVIEFHDISNYNRFNLMTNFISKIDLKLIHTHINNYSYIKTADGYIPDVVELSFTSSQNIYLSDLTLPHRLDMPNNPADEDFTVYF